MVLLPIVVNTWQYLIGVFYRMHYTSQAQTQDPYLVLDAVHKEHFRTSSVH